MFSQQFNIIEIEQQVLDFMRSLGIQPYDEHLEIDDELHRYRVHDDKRGDKSGAYCIHTDGVPAGFVQDWKTGVKSDWKYDTSELTQAQINEFSTPAFIAQAEEAKRKREQELKKKHARAAELAKQLFEQLKPAPDNHAYLRSKHIHNHGLRIQEKKLAVPLRNINGVVKSIQWIDEDGTKRFQTDAPLEGVFFSIALNTLKEKPEQIILIGEEIGRAHV